MLFSRNSGFFFFPLAIGRLLIFLPWLVDGPLESSLFLLFHFNSLF